MVPLYLLCFRQGTVSATSCFVPGNLHATFKPSAESLVLGSHDSHGSHGSHPAETLQHRAEAGAPSPTSQLHQHSTIGSLDAAVGLLISLCHVHSGVELFELMASWVGFGEWNAQFPGGPFVLLMLVNAGQCWLMLIDAGWLDYNWISIRCDPPVIKHSNGEI